MPSTRPILANKTLRQTFFYNQVGYQHRIKSSEKADFKVNEEFHFSVGNKYTVPVAEDSYAAADMIELGNGRTIPLWLFGFLY